MTPDDPECTDCEGSGIMHQTERYCTCGVGFILSSAATLEPIAPPDVAQAAQVVLDWWGNVDQDDPTLDAAIGVCRIMGETQEEVDRFPAALRVIADGDKA